VASGGSCRGILDGDVFAIHLFSRLVGVLQPQCFGLGGNTVGHRPRHCCSMLRYVLLPRPLTAPIGFPTSCTCNGGAKHRVASVQRLKYFKPSCTTGNKSSKRLRARWHPTGEHCGALPQKVSQPALVTVPRHVRVDPSSRLRLAARAVDMALMIAVLTRHASPSFEATPGTRVPRARRSSAKRQHRHSLHSSMDPRDNDNDNGPLHSLAYEIFCRFDAFASSSSSPSFFFLLPEADLFTPFVGWLDSRVGKEEVGV
jgi:hypothetical protein